MNTPTTEIKIKRLDTGDVALLQQLIQLFREVFEREEEIDAEPGYLSHLLRNNTFVAVAALLNDKVIGGLTAYELPMYYSASSEMFIYDVAVSTEYQQRGIGKQLLTALKKYCQQQNILEIFVAAHAEDTHALEFYQATGGVAEDVVHFTYSGE
jgi:aminoglycoside 3-N-acetyltransferase I